MPALRGRVAESARAMREVVASPDLRRLQLALAAFYSAEWAYVVALGVFAYQAGGPLAVGLVGFLRLLPAAVATPFASLLADRYRRELVLRACSAARAAALGASAAAVLAGAPAGVVYALAAAVTLVAAPYRPAQWAIVPVLARSPRELVAANAASSTTEGLAVLAGPAAAGTLLAVTGPGTVFAAAAALCLVSALGVVRIRTPQAASFASPRASVADALAGFGSVARDPHPRLLIALFGAQTLVRGALNVLIVVAALEILGMGEPGVGFLTAAFGVGGLVGATAAFGLAGRRRLAGPFGLGLVVWGVPIALVALVAQPGPALVLIALVGLGNSVLDVAGLTLVQRLVADAVLARVFGVLETLALATMAVGALATPLLIGLAGTRGALVVTGAALPLLALLVWRRLRVVDEATDVPDRALALLRGVPMLAPLAPATIERLASRLKPVAVPAGGEVVRRGEPGDRFYLVESGQLEAVPADGRARPLGPGESFGEIALLRDVPRTATVTARTDAVLQALDRGDFLGAVARNVEAARAAEAVVASRLGPAGP